MPGTSGRVVLVLRRLAAGLVVLVTAGCERRTLRIVGVLVARSAPRTYTAVAETRGGAPLCPRTATCPSVTNQRSQCCPLYIS